MFRCTKGGRAPSSMDLSVFFLRYLRSATWGVSCFFKPNNFTFFQRNITSWQAGSVWRRQPVVSRSSICSTPERQSRQLNLSLLALDDILRPPASKSTFHFSFLIINFFYQTIDRRQLQEDWTVRLMSSAIHPKGRKIWLSTNAAICGILLQEYDRKC